MTQDEIAQLARELISKVVPELQEKHSLTFIEEGGVPVLVATSGDSVLHFNPQQWAEKIIAEKALYVETLDAEMNVREAETEGYTDTQKAWTLSQSEESLIELLSTVDVWLGEGLWVLSRLAKARVIDERFGPFLNIPTHVKWLALRDIDSRLRELLRLPEKDAKIGIAEMEQLSSGNYDYAISGFDMISALMKLERFSIKGLARLLAPERDDFRPSVYDWMRRKGMDRAELERWWRKVHRGVEKEGESSDTVENPGGSSDTVE